MGTMRIQDIHVTPNNVEDVLQLLLDDTDVHRVESSSGLALRELIVRMRTLRHNDDAFHQGETILEHTQWVLADLDALTVGMPYETRQILNCVALFHDLGKAFTHTVEGVLNRFYRHAQSSVLVVEALLSRERSPEFFLIRDLVRLHDVFLSLAQARRQRTDDSLHYLNSILREQIVQNGQLDLLITFVRADTMRAQVDCESSRSLAGVLRDIVTHRDRAQAAVELRQRMAERAVSRVNDLRDLLAEVPEAAGMLPDVSRANEVLGRVQRYDLIRGLHAALLEGEQA
jgi:hypothetical protein